ncbi:MAG: beta-hexosaminidase precursor, partial [Clostridia bacterium]|nr:beta-hexosaminidase precursor [Clostridia bacterium]
SVSQNDWYGYCQCEKCKAIDEEEDSPAGSLIRFVNAVADAVKDEFPDRYIDTLAYQYTRKPPQITKPHDNVIIRLCSIECCFAHDFESCTCHQQDANGRAVSRNGTFVADMKAWAKIAKNIYVWDYVVDFSHYFMPFPNLKVLQKNIIFFINHNVKGLFEQGCYTTEHGEMNELKAYVIAKLLWNPYYDIDIAINEFLTGYFGMAAAPIRKYLDILNDRVAENTPEGFHFGCFETPAEKFFTSEFIAEVDELFDRAEALAENDDILKRVEIARIAVRYVKMYLNSGTAAEKKAYLNMFFEDAQRFGIARINEWQDLMATKENMEKQIIN